MNEDLEIELRESLDMEREEWSSLDNGVSKLRDVLRDKYPYIDEATNEEVVELATSLVSRLLDHANPELPPE